MLANGFVYGLLRGLALNFASTQQTENPRGFSEVGENKQLIIHGVGHSNFNLYYSVCQLSLCFFSLSHFSQFARQG